MILVLDAEAVSNLRSPDEKHIDSVRAAIQVAIELKRPVLVPAVVLAELYRGARENASLDALLNRDGRLLTKDTSREFARFVGGVLAAAGADSSDMVDAHCVATAVERWWWRLPHRRRHRHDTASSLLFTCYGRCLIAAHDSRYRAIPGHRVDRASTKSAPRERLL